MKAITISPTIAAIAIITLISPSIFPEALVWLLEVAVAVEELAAAVAGDELAAVEAAMEELEELGLLDGEQEKLELRSDEREGNVTGGEAPLQIPWAVVCVRS